VVTKEILAVLDEYAKDYDFPVLDATNFDMAQTRLTAFKKDTDWLITIEIIGSRGDILENAIYAYGNAISAQGLVISVDDYINPVDSEYWYDDEGEELLVNPYDFKVYVEDELLSFKPSLRDYQAAGITEVEPYNLTKLIRYISYVEKDKLWLSVKTLLDEVKVDDNMEVFYQADAWNHPDISELKPSESLFFKKLATALEQGDVSLIVNANHNTHWSQYTWSDLDNEES